MNKLNAYYKHDGKQEITIDRDRDILKDLVIIDSADKESADRKTKNKKKSKGRSRK